MKRGTRKAGEQPETPEVVDLTPFGSTDEISHVLSDSANGDAATPVTTDEQIVEGHPS